MLRYGHITELDATKGMAKVMFDEDNIVSDWLQIVVRNSISNKSESWFDVNEFVCVMMDKHDEEGVILGAVYHEGNTPPIGDKDTVGVTFPDGTVIKYNRSDSKFTIECVGEVNVSCTKANVTASDSVNMDTPSAQFTGDVSVQGTLSASGLTSSGDVEASGDIKADGSMKALGQVEALSGTPLVVHLSTHNHPTAPTGPISPPTPGT
jgi:phage baseplate assembly protein V